MASDCTDGTVTAHSVVSHSTSGASTFLKIFFVIISQLQNWPSADAAIACTRRQGFFCTSCRIACTTCAPAFFWNTPVSATDTKAIACSATKTTRGCGSLRPVSSKFTCSLRSVSICFLQPSAM